MHRASAINVAMRVQVGFDRCVQGLVDQRQQWQLTGSVFSIDHQFLERRYTLGEGDFVLSAFAGLLHFQGKPVERLQIRRGRVDCGEGSR